MIRRTAPLPLAGAALLAALLASCAPPPEPPAPPEPTIGVPAAGTRTPVAPPPSRSPSRSASPSASATGPRPTAKSRAKQAVWRPEPGTAWQWQLDGRVDTGVDVPVYDIDGFNNDASVVAELHRAGRKVICYVNAGSWESYRPDAAAFPRGLLGDANGWRGERWLDVRRVEVLRPLMAKRFDMCRDKGFDGVEADLLDGYTADTGFPLTGAHQLAYNRMIAELAHERGLAVGLKNDLEQIPQLVGVFDFAVNEECAEYDSCAPLAAFVRAGKAVFHAEYALSTEEFCGTAKRLGLSSIRKKSDLGVWRESC
ncbi:endo alpha-1,4 polygalactosaminidase [Streptomyces sp. NPDC001941]|uniref:endo alpha-1,4 polygalactosaminidase n=1 Tax=Streptomyces sp. NPDC001941 TaxID=3154659 RepID=UPI00331D2225